MDLTIVFLFVGIILLAAFLLFIMSFGKKRCRIVDVEKYRVKYLKIEQQLKKSEPSTYHMSVLNGDKLVDEAMKELGARGETMGERLKYFVARFSDRNGIWTAHKLRNRIAHESDIVVTYEDAKYALNNFRKALKDLGAI